MHQAHHTPHTRFGLIFNNPVQFCLVLLTYQRTILCKIELCFIKLSFIDFILNELYSGDGLYSSDSEPVKAQGVGLTVLKTQLYSKLSS